MSIIYTYDAASGEATELEVTETELDANRITEQEQKQRDQDNAKAARRGAFAVESDPLFFAWQRGEGTEQEWLDKVQEIRERFPYA